MSEEIFERIKSEYIQAIENVLEKLKIGIQEKPENTTDVSL
jgi:hypothetical protein